jgi:hypothetical protein
LSRASPVRLQKKQTLGRFYLGLARTFYVVGRIGSQLFDGDDPFAENRDLNDSKYAIDHFKMKPISVQSDVYAYGKDGIL